MKRTIFVKIAAGYCALVVIMAAALFFFSVRTFTDHYRAMLVDVLRNQAALLLPVVEPLLIQKKIQDIQTVVLRSAADTGSRFTVIAPDGSVVADSEKDPLTMENHRTRPEIMQAFAGSLGTAVRYSSTLAEDMLYVAVPLNQHGKISGVLRVSLHMRDIRTFVQRFQNILLVVVLCVAGLAVCAALYLSRRISRPVRMLDDAAKSVAAGKTDVRVFLNTGDEIQECADSFNRMAARIKAQFDEINLRRMQLENIIAAMHEYLLVIDPEGRIILSNRRFDDFIGVAEARGKFYWECIRDPAFADMVRSVRASHKERIEELTLDNNVLLCSMAWIEQHEEIIAVCLDITEVRNVERMKKDFVVNVSHELRTPLTAIKGFIETMRDEITDQAHQRYIDIIKRHTDRLISIVQDLLTLARLEQDTPMDIERVNLADLLDQVKRIYEPVCAAKGLALDVRCAQDVVPIAGDSFKIEQLLINLIDNAIKYTEQGGVTVTAARDDDHILITVEDTGIGIRNEHVDRIFERFYVVDKARSRQAGGTGLGLSIVKHIVLLHRGTITVSSTYGKGSIFTVRLPIAFSEAC